MQQPRLRHATPIRDMVSSLGGRRPCKEFRRKPWLEGSLRGMVFHGCVPTEMDQRIPSDMRTYRGSTMRRYSFRRNASPANLRPTL